MANIYRQFLGLLPARPLLVGTVTAVGDGVATVELPGGGLLRARGAGTVGQRVWVRDGAIEGEAPDLAYVEAEV
jgi:hypothetical protein